MNHTQVAQYMRAESKTFGACLERIPEATWPSVGTQSARVLEVWRSRSFLVVVYQDRGYERLSVVRTELALNGRFAENITWDDLQRLKRECGRGSLWAVEVFPDDAQLVNVQNMRHLFVLPDAPPYGWRVAQNNASEEAR